MDNILKIGLIGPGRMGVNYAKVIQQNPFAELVAVCGNTVENTQRNASGFNVPLYFNNEWENMFKEYPEINTVLITTSEWAHFEPFKASLENNKNVIIEKPVAIDPLSISEMKKVGARYPHLKKLVCFTCRFDNRYIQAKKNIDSNLFGKVGYIYSRRNADSRIASRIVGKFPIPYWIIVHDIDLMRWLTGAEVVEVSAFESLRGNKGHLTVRILFDNEVTGLIESTFFSEPIAGQHHTRMDIECEKGKIELSVSDGGVTTYHSEEGMEAPDVFDFFDAHGVLTGSTPLMINHFIDVILNNVKPVVDFHDGITAVEISNYIQQAIESKKNIRIK
jgi:predicted dehydrogenase